jgi:hypothetical protein
MPRAGGWTCRAGQCAADLDTPGLRSSATCRAGLAERESQQARAQQHKAGCGQREESVGNKVVITHDTPATLDAHPNLLKLSESAFFERGVGFAEVRPSSDSPQMRGQEKCRR